MDCVIWAVLLFAFSLLRRSQWRSAPLTHQRRSEENSPLTTQLHSFINSFICCVLRPSILPFGLLFLFSLLGGAIGCSAAHNPPQEKRRQTKGIPLSSRAPLKLISFHQIAQFFHNLLSFINFISRLGPQTAQQTSFLQLAH